MFVPHDKNHANIKKKKKLSVIHLTSKTVLIIFNFWSRPKTLSAAALI